jgi:hypothetical protein
MRFEQADARHVVGEHEAEHVRDSEPSGMEAL